MIRGMKIILIQKHKCIYLNSNSIFKLQFSITVQLFEYLEPSELEVILIIIVLLVYCISYNLIIIAVTLNLYYILIK